jgi:hypothetical protein
MKKSTLAVAALLTALSIVPAAYADDAVATTPDAGDAAPAPAPADADAPAADAVSD